MGKRFVNVRHIPNNASIGYVLCVCVSILSIDFTEEDFFFIIIIYVHGVCIYDLTHRLTHTDTHVMIYIYGFDIMRYNYYMGYATHGAQYVFCLNCIKAFRSVEGRSM